MIFSLVLKYWKNILDALIVIAIIIGIYLINPGNIFKGRLRSHSTTNNISAIREIGQLITAEYYGETISTIDQSSLQMIYAENIAFSADSIFQEMKHYLLGIYVKTSKGKIPEKKSSFINRLFEKIELIFVKSETDKAIEKELDEYEKSFKDELSIIVMEYFQAVHDGSELKPKKSLSNKKDVLKKLIQDLIENAEKLNEIDFNTYMKEGLPVYKNKVFSDYYYDKKRESLTRKEKKKELSMIGRGWVKAGFNFDKLDEGNFYFDKEQGVVHLFGVHPEILNADINPWFIPEKKIPGFQIIESNRHVDFYDVVKVKSYCVEKLRKMAIDAGILEQAERQGKEALKSFIGLLTNSEIKEVYFHYDSITVLTKEILNDHFISYEESLMLDTLIEQQIDTILKLDKEKTNYSENQKLKEIKTQQLKALISNLKKVFFEEKDHYYNRLSMLVFKITADSILTHNEIKALSLQRWDIEKTLISKTDDRIQLENMIWYSTNLDFINEFNSAINEVSNLTMHFGNRRDSVFNDKSNFDKFEKQLGDSNVIIRLKYSDKATTLTYIDNTYKRNSLLILKYPLVVAQNWQNMLDDKNNISTSHKCKSDKTHDTLFIGPKITYQIFGTYNTKFDSLSISKDQNKVWHIDSIGISNNDQLRFLEFNINYYKTYSTGFFTKANRRLTESLKPEKIMERGQALRGTF